MCFSMGTKAIGTGDGYGPMTTQSKPDGKTRKIKK